MSKVIIFQCKYLHTIVLDWTNNSELGIWIGIWSKIWDLFLSSRYLMNLGTLPYPHAYGDQRKKVLNPQLSYHLTQIWCPSKETTIQIYIMEKWPHGKWGEFWWKIYHSSFPPWSRINRNSNLISYIVKAVHNYKSYLIW